VFDEPGYATPRRSRRTEWERFHDGRFDLPHPKSGFFPVETDTRSSLLAVRGYRPSLVM
jgi:hypothetical protein